MSPKRQRLLFAVFGVGFLTAATMLVMNAFSEHLVFFYTPSQLEGKSIEPQQLVRIGGLVEDGSVSQQGMQLQFTVTDLTATLDVTYEGIPPALFREGQGVVAEGFLRGDILHATKLLAKHDENYMPPEVAKALEASGKWKHHEQAGGNASAPYAPASSATTRPDDITAADDDDVAAVTDSTSVTSSREAPSSYNAAPAP